jgi:gluconate:H+ symporter, GntP family
MLQHDPDGVAGVRCWAGIKEYVLAQLTGDLVIDHGIASATGLFSLSGRTWLSTLDTAGVVDGDEVWVQGFVLVGQTPIALLISVLMAMWLLGWKRGQTGTQVEATVNSALGPVCSIILVTGAGGMLGAVLRASGIGEALATSLEGTGGLSDAYLALTVIAIACGSTVLSHVNDSGFWLVGRFLGMDVKTTFRTWAVMETLLGTIGFTIAWVLSAFV